MNRETSVPNSGDEMSEPLSPASVAMLESLVSGYLAARSGEQAGLALDGNAFSTSAIVAYLSGVLTETESLGIERKAVQSREARTRLRDISHILARLRNLPWPEVQTLALSDGLEGETAKSWLGLVSQRIVEMPAAHESWLTVGWKMLSAAREQSGIAAQVAWASLAGFAANLRSAMSATTFALARGTASSEVMVLNSSALPERAEVAFISREIDENGSLAATARVMVDDVPLESCPPLAIGLRVGSSVLPLEWAQPVDGTATWELANAAAMLGLQRGTVPAKFLIVIVGNVSLDELVRTEREYVYANAETIEDSFGEPLEIEVAARPKWSKSGEFSVALAIEPSMRIAFDGYDLQIDLFVTSNFTQRIGQWQVRDWPDDGTPRRLIAYGPGTLSGKEVDIPPSMLRIKLIPQ